MESNGKRCTRCRELKPLDAFTFDRRTRDGRTSHCRECNKATHKEWYAKPSNKKWNRDRMYLWKSNHPLTHWASDTIASHKNSGYEIMFKAKELSLMAEQNLNCWLCGQPLIYKGERGNPYNATIDRLNNEKTLTLNSIRIVHYACNAGKSNDSLENYLKRCCDTAIKHGLLRAPDHLFSIANP